MDRVIRLMLAFAFASMYFTGIIQEGIVATVLWVIGIIFIVTSLIGFCPLYCILRINTAKKGNQ